MKNIDYINHKISKEKNIKLSTVKLVNEFYWSEIKKAMSSLEDQFIFIKKIGTFEVSQRKTNKMVKRLRDIIKKFRKINTFKPEVKEKRITYYKGVYKKLMNIKRIVDENIEFRKTYKINIEDE